jgi:hypothetical protein
LSTPGRPGRAEDLGTEANLLLRLSLDSLEPGTRADGSPAPAPARRDRGRGVASGASVIRRPGSGSSPLPVAPRPTARRSGGPPTPPGWQEQDRELRTLLRPCEIQPLGAVPGLDRPQDPECRISPESSDSREHFQVRADGLQLLGRRCPDALRLCCLSGARVEHVGGARSERRTDPHHHEQVFLRRAFSVRSAFVQRPLPESW